LLARDDAFPDLHRARPTLNAEGRRRADAIMEEMSQRRMKRFLQYGREGRVDLLLEWASVAGARIEADAFWECVLEVSLKHLKRTASEQMLRDWNKFFESGTWADFRKKGPLFIDGDSLENAQLAAHVAALDRTGLKAKHLMACIIVSTA